MIKLRKFELVIRLTAGFFIDLSDLILIDLVVEKERVSFRLPVEQHNEFKACIEEASRGLSGLDTVLLPWYDGVVWRVGDFSFLFPEAVWSYLTDMGYREVTKTTYLQVSQTTYLEVSDYFSQPVPHKNITALLVANYNMGKAMLYFCAMDRHGNIAYYVSSAVAKLLSLETMEPEPVVVTLAPESKSAHHPTNIKQLEKETQKKLLQEVEELKSAFEEEFGDFFD